MPVTGANKIKARMKSFVGDVTNKKSLQFINAVGAQAGILSKEKAPLEYGTLHNSQRFDVTKGVGYIKGTLSYNTEYAAALNNPSNRRSGVLKSSRNTAASPYNASSIGAGSKSPRFNMVSGASWSPKTLIEKSSSSLSPAGSNGSWNPRPPLLKDGPAWNPNATPRFLEYGFESKEGQAAIIKYLEIFKI